MFGCSRSGGACRLAEGHGPSSDSERAALAAIAKVAPYAGAPCSQSWPPKAYSRMFEVLPIASSPIRS
jgi:hypothetical protein